MLGGEDARLDLLPRLDVERERVRNLATEALDLVEGDKGLRHVALTRLLLLLLALIWVEVVLVRKDELELLR